METERKLQTYMETKTVYILFIFVMAHYGNDLFRDRDSNHFIKLIFDFGACFNWAVLITPSSYRYGQHRTAIEDKLLIFTSPYSSNMYLVIFILSYVMK